MAIKSVKNRQFLPQNTQKSVERWKDLSTDWFGCGSGIWIALLRCPAKSSRYRSIFSTAATFSPRFFVHRTRFGSSPHDLRSFDKTQYKNIGQVFIPVLCFWLREWDLNLTTFGLWARRATGLLHPAMLLYNIPLFNFCQWLSRIFSSFFYVVCAISVKNFN